MSGLRLRGPTWTEVVRGARDTRLLLRLRWRLVRTRRARLGMWLGLVALTGGVLLAANTGAVVRSLAEGGRQSAAGTYAVNYVIAFDRGELGLIGATALGAALLASLLAPFTGTSVTGLATEDSLAGLRPARLHRYFDSLVTTAASTVGFLQLFVLTAVGSLLTLSGGRIEGLVFMWSIWPFLVLLSVAEGWLVELVHRSVGGVARRLMLLGVLSGVVAALVLDPDHGRSLFGLGGHFVATIDAATAHDWPRIASAVAVLTVLSAGLLAAGLLACRSALGKPAGAAVVVDRRVLVPVSARPGIAMTQVLLAQVWRTRSIRRPIATVVVVGLPAALLAPSFNVMSTFVVAIPLAVALAAGVNFFGVIGHAMPWLASQPGLMRMLLWQVMAVQVLLMGALVLMVWWPGLLFGILDPGDAAAVAAASLVSILFTTRSATHKSLTRPFLVQLGSRSDMIAPPLTTVGYTLRLGLWSGQLGVLVLTQDGLLQLGLVGAAVVVVAVRTLQLGRRWADRDVQSFVVRQVSAA